CFEPREHDRRDERERRIQRRHPPRPGVQAPVAISHVLPARLPASAAAAAEPAAAPPEAAAAEPPARTVAARAARRSTALHPAEIFGALGAVGACGAVAVQLIARGGRVTGTVARVE